ncbi:MAG: DUF1045 domain-containing protein [Rhizobiales bacterium]|nr:DUF1045 domain-containing protein [Hyphomicrobiales bacterium]
MSGSARYAIYFVPPAGGTFYRFGSGMLGYDCYTGADVALPRDTGLPEDWAALTEAPRRYGFHATLCAPFRLTPECDEAALLDAFAGFAGQPRGVAEIRPVVRALGKFIAIVPRDRDTAVDTLAADCVRYFDRFRAPLSSDDRERRMTPTLSERERSNVDRWGYPYVLDDFCFHLTLTGTVADDRGDILCHLLSNLFLRSHGRGTIKIDRVALLRQDHEGARFLALREAELGTVPGPRARQALR